MLDIIKICLYIVNCFNMNMDYKSFLTNDMINSIIDYELIIKNRPNKSCFKYWITGIPFIDDKYLNPYNKRPNDKFYNHNNYNVIELRLNNKSYQIGFNSFIEFIKPFIKLTNVQDYFNRFNDYSELDLSKDLFKSFSNQDIYKINLSNIDIEKLNKKYLFFKNDLVIGRYSLKFIRYDEFLKSVPLKSSYKINQLINKEFYNNKYSSRNKLLTNFICLVEKLDYDDKYTFLIVNKAIYRDLIKTINNNQVKWSKTKNNKLLKQIHKYRYQFNDYDDIYNDLLKLLKNKQKKLEKLNNKIDWIKKELDIEKQRKNSKRYKKLSIRFDNLNIEFNELSNELDNINDSLIELDKSTDEFKNNMLDYKNNLSLKLKSYLD